VHSAHRMYGLAAVALLIAALSGCTQKEPAAATAPPQTAPAQSAPQQAAPPAVQPAASALAATPAFPAPAASNALSADGETPGTRITINELKRGTNTLTLRFTMSNNSAKTLGVGGTFNDSDNYAGYRNVSAVHLIDAASKKKYFVVADTDRTCVCSENISDLAANAQVSLWAKFPAPPDDVQKITVEVPHFMPVEDVPITR